MSTIVTLAALLLALTILNSNASKGINPVQHSERTASQASKGINPVQHSE
ncbi:MAG TPA: hypothetical protein VGB76_12160 [Pyrinomonadaceae bacterium]|jgi:hypothetical protein